MVFKTSPKADTAKSTWPNPTRRNASPMPQLITAFFISVFYLTQTATDLRDGLHYADDKSFRWQTRNPNYNPRTVTGMKTCRLQPLH